MTAVYILGGYQTDFSINWKKSEATLADMFVYTVQQGLEATGLKPARIDVGHVGNFVAELFAGQGQLGGFFGHVDPNMTYLPASRHEAACASGSMAIMAAMSDIAAGHYETACVLGIEMMRNVPSTDAADYLRPAAWADKEWQDTPFVWPCAFDQLVNAYQSRYQIETEYLRAISQKNFTNAKGNGNAQTRNWEFTENSFSDDDEANPVVSGTIRKQDCGQLTDGAAVVFLANERQARQYADENGLGLCDIPRIKGWGHSNAPMLFAEKMRLSKNSEYLFPHLHHMIGQTLARGGFSSVSELCGLEVHDCFNITEYMILDHCGLYTPGEVWQGIETGHFEPQGALPVNSSGGLIGLGHPVGATGVRMVLDAYKQVAGKAGDYQIEQACDMMTINLGGSATTCASFIVGKD